MYKKGFTAGVFDLFHIGHLNLLRRCKEYCEYLIVGVMTDEFTEFCKGKKPYISLEDRMEILSAIRYVDQVVPVDIHNTSKVDAWKLYQFDCCFSGDDHIDEECWINEKNELKKQGVDIVFFPYTTGVSSTKIKESIGKDIKEK